MPNDKSSLETGTGHPAADVSGNVTPVLEMRGIQKSFPGVRALANVSFSAYAGEIHALMGENGAGKSTLMKVLSGAYQADPGGSILIGGTPVVIDGPLAGRQHGIAIIYQELALSPNLSVAENVFLGREKSAGGMIDRKAMAEACRPVMERLAVGFSPETKVAALSIAERQLVEIVRALTAQARILVMDEPTTSLSARETERLFALIRQLKAEGMAIIYISHRMGEVYELADRVSVLRDGTFIGTLAREDINADAVVRMMVGRDLSSFYKKDHRAPPSGRPVVIEVDDIADGRRVHGCSFAVHEGEVLGIAGLVGAGRTELARLIYGADKATRGRIRVDGREIAIRDPETAIDAGVVYLTEDRKTLGLFLDMTIRENINIGVIGRDSGAGGTLNFKAAKARAAAAMKSLAIRAPTDVITVGALSGGNQQKVLLSRLLETKPRVLILDEPTRGVDIGAKSEIYRLIDSLAQSGIAVVVISSELPEVIGISDRIVVMRDGRLVGEVDPALGADAAQQAVMALATGVAGAAA